MNCFKGKMIKGLGILYFIFMLCLFLSIIIGIFQMGAYYYFVPLVFSLISLSLICLLLHKKKLKINILKIFPILLIIAVILYIILLFLPYNNPFVDYETFYYSATQFSLGGTYNYKYIALFPHLWGYIYFLGTIFKFFGTNYTIVVGTNIVLNFITAFTLYKILTKLSSKNNAYLGVLFWLFNPINIIWCMFAFGGTAFNAFFAIAIYILILLLCANKKKEKIVYAILLGTFLGIANLFRPIIIIMIIAIAIILIYKINTKKNRKKKLTKACFAIILALYLAVGKINNIYLEKEIGYTPAEYTGFNLYNGSSMESMGSYSLKAGEILNEKLNSEVFDANKIQKDFQELAIENYKDNGMKNIELIIQKFVTLTGNVGGYSWSNVTSMLNIEFSIFIDKVLLCITLFSYYFLLAMNLAFAINTVKTRKILDIYIVLVLFLGGFTIASLFLEVSARYYLPTLIPFTILGIVGFTNQVTKEGKND